MKIIRFHKINYADAYFNPDQITYIDAYTYKDYKTNKLCEGSEIHFTGQDALRIPIDRETLIKNLADKIDCILEQL